MAPGAGWRLLPLCTEMIVTGAWWDHVDGVSPRIGALLLAHRSLDGAGDPGVVDEPGPVAAPEQHHLPARRSRRRTDLTC